MDFVDMIALLDAETSTPGIVPEEERVVIREAIDKLFEMWPDD